MVLVIIGRFPTRAYLRSLGNGIGYGGNPTGRVFIGTISPIILDYIRGGLRRLSMKRGRLMPISKRVVPRRSGRGDHGVTSGG